MRVDTMRATSRRPVDREVQVAPAPSRAPKEGQRGAKAVKRPLPPAGTNQDLRSKTLAAGRLRGSFFACQLFACRLFSQLAGDGNIDVSYVRTGKGTQWKRQRLASYLAKYIATSAKALRMN
ncbi:MAG TPA: hypothetical protein PK344_17965 [Syntrophorhabdaceae bacterium]|nr:hypothetical protein [Syntrophorhabdaceae bacterium]